VDEILDRGDRYFHMADLPSYLEASSRAAQDYRETVRWAQRAILNVARTGMFSSDRTVREYARDIWHIRPARGEFQPLTFPPSELHGAEVSR